MPSSRHYKLFLLLSQIAALVASDLNVGDGCNIKVNKATRKGICKTGKDCVDLERRMSALGLTRNDIVNCGFTAYEEVICCPQEEIGLRSSLRPAEQACKVIESDMGSCVIQNVLGGTPVELGRYPHMAALGFKVNGRDVFSCGGTLIDKRFVLTAAHCVNFGAPDIVRLGVVNLTDAQQIREGLDVQVAKVHIHKEFQNGKIYNDIALLELAKDVIETRTIYPTCLYTDENDPPDNAEFYVTGWGVTNITSGKKSEILLKAKQDILPAEQCDKNYNHLRNRLRTLNKGVINTQICAFDPNGAKDSCQGDSGGPLIMVIDESKCQYRVVGVVSTGVSCGNGGVYTRVVSYLDYIESIVWPNITNS